MKRKNDELLLLNKYTGDSRLLERLLQAADPLLRWYSHSARPLPWRECPTAYRVWISEIMLQQTRVEAVKPYYQRFLEALPDIPSLASVEEDRLMKLWEGLGYYSRARNLKRAAQETVERFGSQLPGDYEQLLTLPGIGEYTAGAIASIAFGIPVPAVDGNVLRVLARYLSSSADILDPREKTAYRAAAMAMLPSENPGDFNQAMMELGATVCLPNTEPRCLLCPLRPHCLGYEQQTARELPYRRPKAPRKEQERLVLAITDAEHTRVLLHKRSSGLLAGLWELPNWERPQRFSPQGLLNDLIAALPEMKFLIKTAGTFSQPQPFGKAKHIFTHIQWNMEGFLITLPVQEAGQSSPSLPEDWTWAGISHKFSPLHGNLQEYPLPSAFRFFVKKLLTLEEEEL